MSKIQPGIYQHYKGQYYQVFGVAKHSETEEQLVVYQCLYGHYDLWTRPLEMFKSNVTLDNGTVAERFKFLHSSI